MFLLTSLVAQADVGDWYVVPSVAYSDDDGDRLINDSIAGGQIQVGKKMGEHFWLEGLLRYHDIDGLPGQEHLEIGINAVGNLIPDSLFSPYAIGGLGYLRADVGLPDFGGAPPAGATASNMTATAGLGLKVRFGDNSRWSLRAAWRMRHAFDSDDSLTDRVGSLGIQYTFGGRSENAVWAASIAALPAAVSDADGDSDGVKNDRDKGPGTAAGAMVDLNGCEFPANFVMQPVYFATGSARLDADSIKALDETVGLLLRHPGLPAEVGGFADSRGSEDFNMELSLVRAEVVRLYLQQAGVRASSLSVRGYGESQPVASNDTAAGRAQNRRVVLEMRDR